jgi:hypothetical protein
MYDYRREPAPGQVVALIVEEFFSFMATRPSYMEDSDGKVWLLFLTKHFIYEFQFVSEQERSFQSILFQNCKQHSFSLSGNQQSDCGCFWPC